MVSLLFFSCCGARSRGRKKISSVLQPLARVSQLETFQGLWRFARAWIGEVLLF